MKCICGHDSIFHRFEGQCASCACRMVIVQLPSDVKKHEELSKEELLMGFWADAVCLETILRTATPENAEDEVRIVDRFLGMQEILLDLGWIKE